VPFVVLGRSVFIFKKSRIEKVAKKFGFKIECLLLYLLGWYTVLRKIELKNSCEVWLQDVVPFVVLG